MFIWQSEVFVTLTINTLLHMARTSIQIFSTVIRAGSNFTRWYGANSCIATLKFLLPNPALLTWRELATSVMNIFIQKLLVCPWIEEITRSHSHQVCQPVWHLNFQVWAQTMTVNINQFWGDNLGNCPSNPNAETSSSQLQHCFFTLNGQSDRK